MSFAELGAMFPKAGGQYVYLREAYGSGRGVSSSAGLSSVSSCAAGWPPWPWPSPSSWARSCPALGTGHVLFSAEVAGLSYSLSAGQVVARCPTLFLTFVNSFGIRSGAIVQNLLTVLRLGTVAALVVLGVLFGVKAGGANFHPLFPPGPGLPAVLKPLGLALVAVFWTYDGWYAVNCTAEEIRDPGRTIPRGLTLGRAVRHRHLRPGQPRLPPGPAARRDLAASSGSARRPPRPFSARGGAALFSALVMVSVFGCLNANILFGPRVFYAMARDGYFFRAMGRLGAAVPGPHRAPSGGRPPGPPCSACRGPTNRSTSTWSSPCCSSSPRPGLAVFVLRRRTPEAARPYRTWGYPVVPAGLHRHEPGGVRRASSSPSPLKSAGRGRACFWRASPSTLVWKTPGRRGSGRDVKIDSPRERDFV
ncbi:MAG: APC family permease [Chromatiales bacterium]|nr:APC family permease [Chromatiales bacterium]